MRSYPKTNQMSSLAIGSYQNLRNRFQKLRVLRTRYQTCKVRGRSPSFQEIKGTKLAMIRGHQLRMGIVVMALPRSIVRYYLNNTYQIIITNKPSSIK